MQLHHLAIQVHDLDLAVAWYRDLFQLELLREWTGDDGRLRAVWLALDGAFLALERCAHPAPSRGPWRHAEPGLHVLAFRIPVSARADWEARLEERRIPLDHRTQWTLFFRDPEGNRLAVSHHPEDLL